ncbi:T-complex protein 1 subunit delta [Ascosphaera acerosa]|nr:T-complex protein 1 subunit delta [Ascosphaera acerosa]
MATVAQAGGNNGGVFKDKEKPMAVRTANIMAARAVADAIRTTNDGNTMLRDMAVMHPAAKMLVDLSSAQDVEAGDGTTSVVVIAGSLLAAAEKLLGKGIHPTIISESFQRAAALAVQILHDMSIPLDLTDRAALLQAASTSLSSKIVSQYSSTLSPIAVDSVLRIIDPKNAENVDLKNIRIVKKVGGTIDETELVDGLVLNQSCVKSAGGPTRVEKAKIGLIQFQLSPPKPDMENQIVVNDYRQMDKIIKEERTYLLNLVKKIAKTKCNVLLIQKSILRDAVNDISLHFLSRLKIACIKEIERDEVEFICKSLGCKPIANIDSFTEDKLALADLVEEVNSNGSRYTKISGIRSAPAPATVVPATTAGPAAAAPGSAAAAAAAAATTAGPTGAATTAAAGSAHAAAPSSASTTTSSSTSTAAATTTSSTATTAQQQTVSIIARGANSLVLDEVDRSLHDALCVMRCLVKKHALIVGGGAPEIEIAHRLAQIARERSGTEAICFKAFADAMEVIPTTLAENAGLNSIKVVTDLRARHANGEKNAGVSIRSGGVKKDISDEKVLQPLLVSTSAVELAAETVKLILRIDDIALSR